MDLKSSEIRPRFDESVRMSIAEGREGEIEVCRDPSEVFKVLII